jgi:hypothetical protein
MDAGDCECCIDVNVSSSFISDIHLIYIIRGSITKPLGHFRNDYNHLFGAHPHRHLPNGVNTLTLQQRQSLRRSDSGILRRIRKKFRDIDIGGNARARHRRTGLSGSRIRRRCWRLMRGLR